MYQCFAFDWDPSWPGLFSLLFTFELLGHMMRRCVHIRWACVYSIYWYVVALYAQSSIADEFGTQKPTNDTETRSNAFNDAIMGKLLVIRRRRCRRSLYSAYASECCSKMYQCHFENRRWAFNRVILKWKNIEMKLFFELIESKNFSPKMRGVRSILHSKKNVNLNLSNGIKFDGIVFAKHPFCFINNVRLWGAGCLDDIWESNEWGQNNLLKYTLWMSWTNKWSSTGSLVSGLHEFLETVSHCTQHCHRMPLLSYTGTRCLSS